MSSETPSTAPTSPKRFSRSRDGSPGAAVQGTSLRADPSRPVRPARRRVPVHATAVCPPSLRASASSWPRSARGRPSQPASNATPGSSRSRRPARGRTGRRSLARLAVDLRPDDPLRDRRASTYRRSIRMPSFGGTCPRGSPTTRSGRGSRAERPVRVDEAPLAQRARTPRARARRRACRRAPAASSRRRRRVGRTLKSPPSTSGSSGDRVSSSQRRERARTSAACPRRTASRRPVRSARRGSRPGPRRTTADDHPRLVERVEVVLADTADRRARPASRGPARRRSW